MCGSVEGKEKSWEIEISKDHSLMEQVNARCRKEFTIRGGTPMVAVGASLDFLYLNTSIQQFDGKIYIPFVVTLDDGTIVLFNRIESSPVIGTDDSPTTEHCPCILLAEEHSSLDVLANNETEEVLVEITSHIVASALVPLETREFIYRNTEQCFGYVNSKKRRCENRRKQLKNEGIVWCYHHANQCDDWTRYTLCGDLKVIPDVVSWW